MVICNEKQRTDIGQFHSLTHPIGVINLLFCDFSKIQKNIISLFLNFFCCLFLQQHSDIKVHPRPKKKAAVEHFSCCHWNINSLSVYYYNKVLLLEAYNALHHYDLICDSETYLDSSISIDEKDISSKAYIRQGGVCIYYKESIGVFIIDTQNLNRIYSLSSFNK